MNKQQLRKQKRKERRSLSSSQQEQASKDLLTQLNQSSLFLAAKSVGLYIASDGEISPQHIAHKAWALGKEVYLPVLNPFGYNKLHFALWKPEDLLVKNRFGILEPKVCQFAPVWKLSLLLMPLVAFDSEGRRLGMGGGFYDRTLAFCKRAALKPKLIGLAHEVQKVEKLEVESWDIPLDGIVTDQHWYSREAIKRPL